MERGSLGLCARAGRVRTGVSAWRRTGHRRHPKRERRNQFRQHHRTARSSRVLLSGELSDWRPGVPCPRALAGQHDHRTPPTPLDRLGHCTWRGHVRDGLRLAVRARCRAVAADGVLGHSAQPDSVGVRLSDRPLPSARHRSDRQARDGVRRGARGDGRDLRRSPRGRRARVPQGERRQSMGAGIPRDARRGVAGATGQDLRAERARSRVLSRSLRLSPGAARLRARSQ